MRITGAMREAKFARKVAELKPLPDDWKSSNRSERKQAVSFMAELFRSGTFVDGCLVIDPIRILVEYPEVADRLGLTPTPEELLAANDIGVNEYRQMVGL
jgi:hypothetical protein